MQTELIKLDIKHKKKLREILKEEERIQIQRGELIAICRGRILKLEDEVVGTLMVLSPLQGG